MEEEIVIEVGQMTAELRKQAEQRESHVPIRTRALMWAAALLLDALRERLRDSGNAGDVVVDLQQAGAPARPLNAAPAEKVKPHWHSYDPHGVCPCGALSRERKKADRAAAAAAAAAPAGGG